MQSHMIGWAGLESDSDHSETTRLDADRPAARDIRHEQSALFVGRRFFSRALLALSTVLVLSSFGTAVMAQMGLMELTREVAVARAELRQARAEIERQQTALQHEQDAMRREQESMQSDLDVAQSERTKMLQAIHAQREGQSKMGWRDVAVYLVREVLELRQLQAVQRRALTDLQAQFSTPVPAQPQIARSRCWYDAWVDLFGLDAVTIGETSSSLALEGLTACISPVREEVSPWRLSGGATQSDEDTGRIPRILWQIAKHQPVRQIKSVLRQAWIDLNPGWEYRFLDEASGTQFMIDHFDGDTNRAYDCLPLGSMRLNMLRHAVLVKYGGVSIDMDSVPMLSIDGWLESFAAVGGGTSIPMAHRSDQEPSVLHAEILVGLAGHAFHTQAIEMIVTAARRVDFKFDDSLENRARLALELSGNTMWTNAVANVLLGHDADAAQIIARCNVPKAECLFADFYKHRRADLLQLGSFGTSSF